MNPNQSAGSATPMSPPPPMPSVARASNNAATVGSTAPVAATSTPSPQPSTAAPQTPTASKSAADGPTVPGSITNFDTTHYGYADDKTPDTDSAAGRGAFGPLVAGDSLALKDSTAAQLGVKPHDRIELTDAQGNTREGTYVDRVPAKDAGERIDIYDPQGSEKKGAPFKAVSARKVSGTASTAKTLYPKNG